MELLGGLLPVAPGDLEVVIAQNVHKSHCAKHYDASEQKMKDSRSSRRSSLHDDHLATQQLGEPDTTCALWQQY